MTDDDRQRYLDELARLGAPEEVREHFRRLVSLGEIGTAPEFRRFMKSIGTPEEIADRQRALKQMVETGQFYQRIFGSLKMVAIWTAAIGTGWLAFQGLLADFFRGIK